MTSLAEQLKQALKGLAFADVGERCGRRAMHAALFPESQAPEAMPSSLSPSLSPSHTPARKWIVLGVGRTLPAHVLAYVLGACRRMEAGLLLISTDAMQVRELLAPHLPALQGIACQTEELAGSSTAGVAQALDRLSGVLFAVSGSEDDPLRPLLRSRRGARSPVPVVLVSQKPVGRAAAKPLRAAGS